jgi:hypothetical protein
LKGIADFANGRRCAKNFGNAMDSSLTAGGAYVTGKTKTSFKGYYRVSAKQDAALIRSFVQFDGEGETANARQRESSGRIVEECLSSKRSAQSLRKRRRLRSVRNASGLRWRPQQRLHQLVAFGGRANHRDGEGQSDELYIYSDATDVNAVARAVAAGRSLSGAGLYWNPSCLKEIRAPEFWPNETPGPILAQYKKHHPAPAQEPTPICKGR